MEPEKPLVIDLVPPLSAYIVLFVWSGLIVFWTYTNGSAWFASGLWGLLGFIVSKLVYQFILFVISAFIDGWNAAKEEMKNDDNDDDSNQKRGK